MECGAGHGEIAAFLAPRFHRVTATDRHPPKGARAHAERAGVTYRPARAESLPFARQSVDLLISMQALHHFDVQKHIAEAVRLVRPGGVFAALAWGTMQLPDPVAARYAPLFRLLDPYWEPQRTWVTQGYNDLTFPGQRLQMPPTKMQRLLTFHDLNKLIANWTAFRAAKQAGETLPEPGLSKRDLDHAGAFVVTWPVVGQAFKAQPR